MVVPHQQHKAEQRNEKMTVISIMHNNPDGFSVSRQKHFLSSTHCSLLLWELLSQSILRLCTAIWNAVSRVRYNASTYLKVERDHAKLERHPG